MPLTTLTYNENVLEHKNFGDTLGKMQGLFDQGKLTADTSHAYYSGHELRSAGVTWEGIYLKMDAPGAGKTALGRSQNRVIIRVKDGVLTEGWAVAWRHDDRLLQLGSGFFERAKTMRAYYKTLKVK